MSSEDFLTGAPPPAPEFGLPPASPVGPETSSEPAQPEKPKRTRLRKAILALLVVIVAGSIGAGLWFLGDIRETKVESLGVSGHWRVERVRVSKFWSWVLKLPKLSDWLDDPGYSGERWWFVSPEGDRTYLTFMNQVVAGPADLDQSGFLSGASSLLSSWGFNAFGYGLGLSAWGSSGVTMPTIVTLPLASWNASLTQDVLADSFGQSVDKACDSVAPSLADSPNIIGILWEHPGKVTPRSLALKYARLGSGTASKRGLVEHIKARCSNSLAQLHSRMPSMRDFTDLLESQTWSAYEMLDQDAEPFAARVFEAYGRQIRASVNARFPLYVNLGPVLTLGTPVSVVKALAPHVDVITFSAWTGDGRLPRRYLEEVHEATGDKPVLILEFGQKLLAGSGPVAQSVRGQATVYRRTAMASAALPFVVGCGWTGYRDSDREAWGFLDEGGRLRAPLAEIATEVNANLAALHRDGLKDEDLPEHYSEHRLAGGPPAQAAVKLPPGLKIDGDLSDWPLSQATLKNVRLLRDLELMGFSLVYVGWNEEGLAIAVEVTDDSMDLLDSRVYWKDSDFVEVLIDVSGTRSESYTPATLHLALLPGGKTASAVAIRHPGDGLASGGGPVVEFGSVRVASSFSPADHQWKIEALIPWTAVKVAPKVGMRVGFNLVVRRVTSAGTVDEAFWASPRGKRGLDHPASWGDLTLSAGGG